MENAASPLFPPSPPGMGDFVAGQNLEALVAARAVARGEMRESVYLWGPEGGGKSHLLRAAAEEAQTMKIPAALINSDADAPKMRSPESRVIPRPFPGLLAVDNAERVGAQNEVALFDWFNCPRDSHFILLAGNCPPHSLPLRPELQTRVGGGLGFCLRTLSDADKSRALALFAGRRGFALPEEIAALMLSRLPRNMAKLTAALADLDSFLIAGNKKLTPRSAREWMSARGDFVFEK